MPTCGRGRAGRRRSRAAGDVGPICYASSVALSLIAGSGRSWVAALHHVFDGRTRLRALGYADEVELARGDGGLYVARVQGTRPKPYEVRIVTGIDESACCGSQETKLPAIA